jgi:hypothetical protein
VVSTSIAAMVLVLTFGSGIVGLYLQKRLPTHHMSGGSLNSLDPTTPAQKERLADAKANFGPMEQTRLLMSLQLSSPIAWPLIISVIGWSMFLFCGFGVLSSTNPTTMAVLALGAISVASAMFLILDLSQPYTGIFRVPASALQETIEAIDSS